MIEVCRVDCLRLGVATAPRHATDPDGLFRSADAAMYDVKGRRPNGVAVAGG